MSLRAKEEFAAATGCELGQFVASDGYALKYRRWAAVSAEKKGYILALHGIQSHSGWYAWSSERLASEGYDVYFPDRRGSGMNTTDRGHAVHEDRLISDVVQFLNELDFQRRTASPVLPLILMSVSWGARLAAVVAARKPVLIDGLALLSPGICARIRPSLLQRTLLKLAARGVHARRLKSIPLDDPQLFTSVPEWQAYIRADEWALRKATLGFFEASVRLEMLAAAAASQIVCPTLMMLAGEDQIIDNAASQRYFEQLATRDAKLIEYRSARHTLEFEPCREEFANDLLGWLDELRAKR